LEAVSGWRLAVSKMPLRPLVNGEWRTADGDRNLPGPLPCAQHGGGLGRGQRLLLALAATLVLSGCGNIEPWVKPYERQQLADPIMSFDPHPVSTSYMHHVFEAREGARGALGSGGGGCGCN
jgi:hypothetical protein